MKQTVDFSDFYAAFRAIRPDNFSRDGLLEIFDYLEEFEQDTGEETELDVIAICCDFSESDVDTLIADYGIEIPDDADDEEKVSAVSEYISYNGGWYAVLDNGSFVYQEF